MAAPVDESSDKPFLPRWVMYAALPGLIAPIVILGFIFVSEWRHAEERCPYRLASSQSLGQDIRVVEEARSCISDVEERRYTLHRGSQTHVLGRRRFPAQAFGPGYRWTATLSAEGEVQVAVDNPGQEAGKFREGTPSERGEVAPR
jgi:hypothetical protein